MKKALVYIILLAALTVTLCACEPNTQQESERPEPNAPQENEPIEEDIPVADATPQESEQPSARTQAPASDEDEYVMTAIILEVGEKIKLSVTESKYAVGEYLVIISHQTAITDSCGDTINADELRVGDTVRVVYGGQVMLSLPPQVAALKITKLN